MFSIAETRVTVGLTCARVVILLHSVSIVAKASLSLLNAFLISSEPNTGYKYIQALCTLTINSDNRCVVVKNSSCRCTSSIKCCACGKEDKVCILTICSSNISETISTLSPFTIAAPVSLKEALKVN